MTTFVAFDTETHPIGVGPDGIVRVAPPMVCCTFASWKDELETVDGVSTNPESCIDVEIYAACDPETPKLIEQLLDDPDVVIVGQWIAFDMGAVCGSYPHLIPKVFNAYNNFRIHCTSVREKVLNLSQFGKLQSFEAEGYGGSIRFDYSLAGLVLQYMGRDISDDKTAKDSWRTNYIMLDGQPISAYPEEAKRYAMYDAMYTLWVHNQQDIRLAQNPGASLETHEFQAAVDFSLFLTTCTGMEIDEVKRAEIAAMLEKELDPSKMPLLLASGILDPGSPPKPKKGGGMTQGKKASIKQEPLRAAVAAVCDANGIEIKMTKGGEKKGPQISCDAEVMDEIAHLDPVLTEYEARQKLQKLVTTELPRMQAPVVHFPFDVLKETGRTSSAASDLYPSANGQNIDPRARPAYKARNGFVLLNVDYNSAELGTKAQREFEIWGHSSLRDLINSGGNPHSFLGAQMAYSFDANFRVACDNASAQTKYDLYTIFYEMRKSKDQATVDFYNHWRTFAKPTGLGYPGGLGAKTFVGYAKSTYGVRISIEQAEQFKRIWEEAHPESPMNFNWLTNNLQDPYFPENFRYTDPMGLVRSNASYCAAANGYFLQSPTAAGAKMAHYTATEACYVETHPYEVLFGCRPLLFLHDATMLEIQDDEKVHERACALQEIMQSCMQKITPDVKVSTEATLMYRWYKEAKPTFDTNGRLVPWQPKAVSKTAA